MKIVRCLAVVLLIVFAARGASAIEVKVSVKALERTLIAQLFVAPEGRYYMKGDPTSPCSVYADQPEVTFKDDRVVVKVHTRAKLGTTVRGTCLGVTLQTNAEVSFIPDAEGESIGFRDARVERLSNESLPGMQELNFLLVPFLSKKLPQQMKVNAADLMRRLLADSEKKTGYALTLSRLKLHSMQVNGQFLVVDADADLAVD
jgi:hypothetical protein